jgi:hypothetical protein
MAREGVDRGSEDRAKGPSFKTLTKAEEGMFVAFRRYTLLRLVDCLYALQPSIPHHAWNMQWRACLVLTSLSLHHIPRS